VSLLVGFIQEWFFKKLFSCGGELACKIYSGFFFSKQTLSEECLIFIYIFAGGP
jgi:hypothetical protein